MTKEDYRHSGPLRVNIIQDGFFVLQQPHMPFPVRNMGQPGRVRAMAPKVCGHHRIAGVLKELRKDKINAHRTLDYVTDFLIEYASVLIESGFPVITIADPTATGEILGPKMFGDYAVPYINRLVDAIHGRDAKVIVHICGRLDSVKKHIPTLHGDAVSTDAMVNLKALKEECGGITVMGNVSTFALQLQEPEAIRTVTEKLLGDGIDIISPACGLSTKTPVGNIAAMTEVVKNR